MRIDFEHAKHLLLTLLIDPWETWESFGVDFNPGKERIFDPPGHVDKLNTIQKRFSMMHCHEDSSVLLRLRNS